MKVKKTKSGYALKCTPSEFEMLQQLDAIADAKFLKGDGKAAYTRRTKGGALFRIDQDTSKLPSRQTGRPGFGNGVSAAPPM